MEALAQEQPQSGKKKLVTILHTVGISTFCSNSFHLSPHSIAGVLNLNMVVKFLIRFHAWALTLHAFKHTSGMHELHEKENRGNS